MYCEKCGMLAHGDRPCGELIQQPLQPIPRATHGATLVVMSPPNRRLGASGWGLRSFAATAGILVAIAVSLATCAGIAVFIDSSNRAERARELAKTHAEKTELTATAKRLAQQVLEKHGINEMSNDTFAEPYEGDVMLIGTGRGEGRSLKKFTIRFHVAAFGKERRWDVKTVMIDDEIVLSSERGD